MRRATIEDASKAVVVVIEEVDRDAIRRSPTRCVVANRLMRLPGVSDARVGARSARVLHKHGWRRYDLDPDTAAMIHAYDETGQVMPAGIRVELLPPKKKLGARAGTKPGTNRRSGKGEHVATRRGSTRSIFLEPEPQL